MGSWHCSQTPTEALQEGAGALPLLAHTFHPVLSHAAQSATALALCTFLTENVLLPVRGVVSGIPAKCPDQIAAHLGRHKNRISEGRRLTQ